MGKGKDLYEENKRLKSELAQMGEAARKEYDESKKIFTAAALVGLILSGRMDDLSDEAIAIGENLAFKF